MALGTTRGRKTRIVFNRFSKRMIQGSVSVDRAMEKIGQGAAVALGVEFLTGIGWSLVDSNGSRDTLWDYAPPSDDNEPAAAAPIAGSVPPGFTLTQSVRNEPLSGVSYAAGMDAERAPRYQKQVAAGGSWDSKLTADQTAYPGPLIAGLSGNLDRVFASTAVADPTDRYIFLVQTGPDTSRRRAVSTFYFPGPASKTETFTGRGQYALVVLNDGAFDIYERGRRSSDGSDSWKFQHRFRQNGWLRSPRMLLFKIQSNAVLDDEGRYVASKLTIFQGPIPQMDPTPQSAATRVVGGAIDLLTFGFAQGTFEYDVPEGGKNPIQPEKVRIDIRRDLRVKFAALNAKYAAAGLLETGNISLKSAPSGLPEMYIDTYCSRPAGTDVETRLLWVQPGDEADIEITGTEVLSDHRGTTLKFELPEAIPYREFRIRLLLSGPGTKTPTIQRVTLRREPAYETPDGQPWSWPYRASEDLTLGEAKPARAKPTRSIERVSVTGPTTDINSDQATVMLADLGASEMQTRIRSGTPIDIDVLDTTTGDLVSRVYRGLIAQPSSTILNATGQNYPAPGAYRANITISGEWARLARRPAPHRILLYNDADNKPLSVTSAIGRLLVAAGIPRDEINIPAIDIPLFGTEDQKPVVQPDAPLLPIIQSLVTDYIGGVLIRDENAGENGLWRVKIRAEAPFNVLARFTRADPPSGRRKGILGALGTHNRALDGATIPILPILRGAPLQIEPPEGNVVIVLGGAAPSGSSIKFSVGQMTQMLVNVRSYNALRLSSSHPKYPDPLDEDALMELVPVIVRDPTLQTPEQVNFVGRRVYDAACFARKVLQITSNLEFVTDPLDPLQVRKRPLMVGDAVEVYDEETESWQVWIVAQHSFGWTKSHHMVSNLELVRTSNIDKFGMAFGGITIRTTLRRIAAMARGFDGIREYNFGMEANRNAAAANVQSELSELPEMTLPPIQDLDPESDTYGEFFAIPGLDPAP